MIFQSLCLGFLPLLDAVGGLVASFRSSVSLHSPSHGGQFVHGHGLGSEEKESAHKSNHAIEDSDPLDLWQLWTLDLLDTSHVHVDLVFPCVCNISSGAPSSQRSHTKQRSRTRKAVIFRGERGGGRDGFSFRRLAARHEQHLTYAVVVATLQVFLRLTRANVTTLFLPMLSQATGGGASRVAGDAVLVLVTTCGVLGSALASRHYGREAMCAISGALIVFCQMAVPGMMEAHAGLSGGGARMAGGHAAGMFAVACVVCGGFSWAWGALFWAVPGEEGIGSVGQAAGAALGFGLGFAQMQCFLLTLRQLKHAAFAYYAVWIWS
ncbi:hypothetical protein HU200_027467 [Digitaria exilis]|uniref:Uncharacterized protein n=1 Tax=Digitaria exilis TaxID=1010633 RepID=A0A835BXL9_9POAL|nr:hypothetical protein HU200_027467 [Digitaria exilis]CAB3484718.1 unnamed protein product [Digitaria exilis]